MFEVYFVYTLNDIVQKIQSLDSIANIKKK